MYTVIENTNLDDMLLAVWRNFFRQNIELDDEIAMYDAHTDRVLDGKKLITMRYEAGGIRLPKERVLPWIETKEDDSSYRVEKGLITIPYVIVGHVKDFPEVLSMMNGFSDNSDMRRSLGRRYATHLNENYLLSAYMLARPVQTDSWSE